MINPVLSAYGFFLTFFNLLPTFMAEFIGMIVLAFCVRALFKNFTT